jgi:hypothetical protein
MKNSEPTLAGIEDYNNTESDEKRKTVKMVILLGLVIGCLYTGAKFMFNSVTDEIPTTQGLNVVKGY